MKELVRLRMSPSCDKKSFRYMLGYKDQSGQRRQVSLGHADKRRAERQRYEKELELWMKITELISMRLTDFFQDSLIRTKGQVRVTTLKDRAKSMRDFTECVGDIDVQNVRTSPYRWLDMNASRNIVGPDNGRFKKADYRCQSSAITSTRFGIERVYV